MNARPNLPTHTAAELTLGRGALVLFAVAPMLWWAVTHLTQPEAFDPMAPHLAVAGLALVSLMLATLRERFAALVHEAASAVAIGATVVFVWLVWANPTSTTHAWQLMAVLAVNAVLLRELLTFALSWAVVFAAGVAFAMGLGDVPDHGLILALSLMPVFVVHGFAVWRDQQVRDQIVERTSLLREIFENATDALLVVSPVDGRILLANQRAAEMFEAPDVDLLLDRDVFELPARALDREVIDRIGAAGDDGEEVRMEVPFRRFGSQPFWGDAAWRAVDIGEHRYLLLRITAIDDRIHAQQALESARDAAEAATVAKSNFLASISHEIRTPLNGVLGIASLLKQTDITEEQDSYVSTLLSSGRTLMSLIDELLDFSRIEAGELVMYEEPFDLRQCVTDLQLLFRAQAEAKDLTLRVQIEDNVPKRIVTDGKRVRQVFVNLLGNALKFTEEGGVTLRAHGLTLEGRERLRIEVTDTGIGIPKGDLPRLFEPFSQGDPGIARRYGGTGLGLAISKTIADRLGGALTARSQPGQGSVFTFDIPLRTAQDSLTTRSGAGPAGTDVPVDRLRPVLLAEDNEVNQLVVNAMLKRLGCDVDTVVNGAEAVERAQERTYDVIFMDVMMPGMDGLEATRHIRDLELPRRPFIVALTAGVMPHDRHRCEAAGMDDFVAKPIQIDDLRVVLQRADHAAETSG